MHELLALRRIRSVVGEWQSPKINPVDLRVNACSYAAKQRCYRFIAGIWPIKVARIPLSRSGEMDDDLDADPMEMLHKSSQFWINAPDHLWNRGNK